MNPAFSAPQLRTFLSLFQDMGLEVSLPRICSCVILTRVASPSYVIYRCARN